MGRQGGHDAASGRNKPDGAPVPGAAHDDRIDELARRVETLAEELRQHRENHAAATNWLLVLSGVTIDVVGVLLAVGVLTDRPDRGAGFFLLLLGSLFVVIGGAAVVGRTSRAAADTDARDRALN